MAPDAAPLPDVYSANELARAAGVPVPQVRARRVRQATIPTIDGALVTLGDAVQACRALRHGRLTASPSAAGIGFLSPTQNGSARSGQTTGGSLLVSGSAPGAVLAVLLVMTIASAPNAGLEPPRFRPLTLRSSCSWQNPASAADGATSRLRPRRNGRGSRTTSRPLPRRTPVAAAGSAAGRLRGAEWVPGTAVEPAAGRTVPGAGTSHQDCCEKSPLTTPTRRAARVSKGRSS